MIRNHQHLFGTIAPGASAISGVIANIATGTNARFQFHAANANATVQSGMLFEILIGGAVVFVQPTQAGTAAAILRFGPPEGTYLEFEAFGEVRIRATNGTASNSLNVHANVFYTIRPE